MIRHHEVEPAAKNGGALLGGFFAPGGEGAIGGFDGLASFGGAQLWDSADDFAGGGIIYVERLARSCLDPLPVDITSFAEKPGVLELGGWAFHFCDGVLHGRLPILTAPGKSVRPATRGKRRLLVLCDGSKRRFDNAEAFSELLVSDHERNENANHIVESSGGDGN